VVVVVCPFRIVVMVVVVVVFVVET